MPRSFPGRLLTGLRLAIGTGAWVAPELSGRAFGLDPAANPQAPYIGRLFAVRDAALGVGLLASEGDARRLWWQLGIGCDLFDAAAGAIAGARDELPPAAATLTVGTALAAAALGAAALAADDL